MARELGVVVRAIQDRLMVLGTLEEHRRRTERELKDLRVEAVEAGMVEGQEYIAEIGGGSVSLQPGKVTGRVAVKPGAVDELLAKGELPVGLQPFCGHRERVQLDLDALPEDQRALVRQVAFNAGVVSTRVPVYPTVAQVREAVPDGELRDALLTPQVRGQARLRWERDGVSVEVA